MKTIQSKWALIAMLSLAVTACGDPAPDECDPATETCGDTPSATPDVMPEPTAEPTPMPEPTPEPTPVPSPEPVSFIGSWVGTELTKSFNGNVFFDYPTADSEMTLTMDIAADMTVDYFLDIDSSDTSMTGTAMAGPAPADLTLDLTGMVTYNSGNMVGNDGDFTCTLDVDTMTCTGINNEEGDELVADMVFERM